MLKEQPPSWTLWCLVKIESNKKHTLAFTISTQMCPTSPFEMLPTHPLLREGFPSQGYRNDWIWDTWHWIDKINSSLLVTYTQCPWKEDTAHDAESHKGNTQKQSEQMGLWQAGFVVSRQEGVPGSYRRMPLACLNNSIVGIPWIMN